MPAAIAEELDPRMSLIKLAIVNGNMKIDSKKPNQRVFAEISP